MLSFALVLFAAADAAPVAEVAAPPTVAAHIQVRTRGEKAAQGNLQADPKNGNARVTERARGILEAQSEALRGRVVLQDVRTWASETGTATDFSADGLDLHEGWAQWGGADRYLRLGRQEIAFDEERLVGAANWLQQGRSFDGARVGVGEKDAWDVTLFAGRVPDGRRHDLVMARLGLELEALRLAVPLIYQDNGAVVASERGTEKSYWNRFTGGLYAASRGGPFDWRVEAYTQNGNSSAAYMVGARLGYGVPGLFKPTVLVDYLSGDPDHGDDTAGAFDTVFGTNHKFYGLFDRVNRPADTANGGLVDVAVINDSVLPSGKLQVAGHYFLLAATDSQGRSGAIGWEANAVYSVPLTNGLALEAGAALYGDLGDYAAGRERTLHDWYYAQLDLQI